MFARSNPGDRNNGGNKEVSYPSLNLRLNKDPELGVLIRSLYNQEPVPYPPDLNLTAELPSPRPDLNLNVDQVSSSRPDLNLTVDQEFIKSVQSLSSRERFIPTCKCISTRSLHRSSLQTVHVQDIEGGGCLHMTGHLGKLMKDSVQIAYALARSILVQKEPHNAFFQNSKLHLLVSEGTTPQEENSSSGCAILTSLLSLATQKPVPTDLAISGAVKLSGRVLPVQDVKDKVISAKRSKVKVLILPQENQGDFVELDENVRHGIDVHFVSHYEQIFKVVFISFSPHLGYSPSLSLPRTGGASSSVAYVPSQVIPTKFTIPPAYLTLEISKITIGDWSQISAKPGDLVARFYFAKKKFEWEQMFDQVSYKMEMTWSTVLSVNVSKGSLNVELKERPKLFRKKTGDNWEQVEDPDHDSSKFRRGTT